MSTELCHLIVKMITGQVGLWVPLLLLVSPYVHAETSDEKDAIAAVQKLFDAMAARDTKAAQAVVIPDGRLYAARPDGKVSGGTLAEFAARLSNSKDPMLERMWNPTVLIRGRIAQVWAEYDFHLNGKFHHCGIDSFTLIKDAEGWKIAGIAYTNETTGCQPSPLGAPK